MHIDFLSGYPSWRQECEVGMLIISKHENRGERVLFEGYCWINGYGPHVERINVARTMIAVFIFEWNES